MLSVIWNTYIADWRNMLQPLYKTVGQFFIEVNYICVRPSNFTSRCLSKRNENLWSHKDLYKNVHSNFI